MGLGLSIRAKPAGRPAPAPQWGGCVALNLLIPHNSHRLLSPLHCPLLQSDPDLTPLPSTPDLTQQSSSATCHSVTTVALQHLQQSVPPSTRRISQAVSPPSSSPALQVLKKFSRFHRVVNRYCYYSDTILNFEDLKSALI
nr:hypothetical protein Iba_chr02dCG4260 [Ipomoea batatas]